MEKNIIIYIRVVVKLVNAIPIINKVLLVPYLLMPVYLRFFCRQNPYLNNIYITHPLKDIVPGDSDIDLAFELKENILSSDIELLYQSVYLPLLRLNRYVRILDLESIQCFTHDDYKVITQGLGLYAPHLYPAYQWISLCGPTPFTTVQSYETKLADTLYLFNRKVILPELGLNKTSTKRQKVKAIKKLFVNKSKFKNIVDLLEGYSKIFPFDLEEVPIPNEICTSTNNKFKILRIPSPYLNPKDHSQLSKEYDYYVLYKTADLEPKDFINELPSNYKRILFIPEYGLSFLCKNFITYVPTQLLYFTDELDKHKFREAIVNDIYIEKFRRLLIDYNLKFSADDYSKKTHKLLSYKLFLKYNIICKNVDDVINNGSLLKEDYKMIKESNVNTQHKNIQLLLKDLLKLIHLK